MLDAQLRAVGGSVMVAVPKPILETLGLTANSPVSLSIEGDSLIIKKKSRRKKTLNEMLAECDISQELTQEDETWLNAPAVGKEFLK